MDLLDNKSYTVQQASNIVDINLPFVKVQYAFNFCEFLLQRVACALSSPWRSAIGIIGRPISTSISIIAVFSIIKFCYPRHKRTALAGMRDAVDRLASRCIDVFRAILRRRRQLRALSFRCSRWNCWLSVATLIRLSAAGAQSSTTPPIDWVLTCNGHWGPGAIDSVPRRSRLLPAGRYRIADHCSSNSNRPHSITVTVMTSLKLQSNATQRRQPYLHLSSLDRPLPTYIPCSQLSTWTPTVIYVKKTVQFIYSVRVTSWL